MRGMALRHGVTFVEHNGVTVKIKDGAVSRAPMTFDTLEFELRTESPDTWVYMTEGDIRGLGEEIFESIMKMTEKKV